MNNNNNNNNHTTPKRSSSSSSSSSSLTASHGILCLAVICMVFTNFAMIRYSSSSSLVTTTTTTTTNEPSSDLWNQMVSNVEELKQVVTILTANANANTNHASNTNTNGNMNHDETMKQSRPFPMPEKGTNYELFQPLYDMNESKKNARLLASPQDFIDTYLQRITWASTMIRSKPKHLADLKSDKDHAILVYLEMIKSFVTGTAFMDAEMSVRPQLRVNKHITTEFDLNKRKTGDDWTFAGDTMTGWARIDNVRILLTDVIRKGIEGDYIETGVWRGGSSVFAKAVISALKEEDKSSQPRVSYVCDSFHGLPPGDKKLDEKDVSFWDHTPYLEVSSDIVANNFIKAGMLDSNVVFAKGFFNETMPPLSKHIQKLSVMRLDGDMYESTVDVLYHLYDKLSIGGYLIMDDWFGFPSKTACEDFFEVHGFSPNIIPIDNLSAYWQKTEEIDIQFWRYEQSKFKAVDKKE